MNTIEYFGDLLRLSPSFSENEKSQIFAKYTQNAELLREGIAIFEEELQQIINVYLELENKKWQTVADFLKSFDNNEKNHDAKLQKIQEIIQKNSLQEASDKDNTHLPYIF